MTVTLEEIDEKIAAGFAAVDANVAEAFARAEQAEGGSAQRDAQLRSDINRIIKGLRVQMQARVQEFNSLDARLTALEARLGVTAPARRALPPPAQPVRQSGPQPANVVNFPSREQAEQDAEFEPSEEQEEDEAFV